MTATPYHPGELQVQQRVGESETARRVGRVIDDRIPTGALGFVDRQRMAILASVDAEGRPWSSVLLGVPGFATAPDRKRVEIDLCRTITQPEDPLWSHLEADPRMGVLFIELASRRRLRVNGHVAAAAENVLRIAVEEAYPNCPKYIQRRRMKPAEVAPSWTPRPSRRGARLEASQRRWIEAADTLFVASVHPEGRADVSHRGGNPGFVEVLDGWTLRIPDYPGNSMYNTLGNFVVHPAAGLLFVDFERHATLQLVGRTEILWDLDGSEEETGGTGRYWDFSVERWIESELPPSLGWDLPEPSPFNPRGRRRA